ncbi:hypothetical protein [Streptomyces sp. XD-27]|uniref:hypothetical protein n=1 Tax=Streptomyces sp. XD-27 TaxID=3062779 RepID=UPI0026F40F55|nr:hypothetical protein [Streptomyces sp. XD-27]WKX69188.1 hypothetical protein Q3Y56_03950 [Streptomyces sp. XD-27]
MPATATTATPSPSDATAAPVPRWARRAATAAALTNVPSGLWRIAIAVGIPVGLARSEYDAMDAPGWGSLFLVCLSVVSEAFALLALGLVRPWGERWPRWVPWLRGRTIPVAAAVIPATLGVVATSVYGVAFVYTTLNGEMAAEPWGIVLLNICYLPLLAWGPLLGAVTVHYYRRRARPAAGPAPDAVVSPPSGGRCS